MRIKNLLSQFIFLFIIFYLISSCSVLNQGKELKTFAECDFNVGNVRVVNIAGVDVSGFAKISDLSINDYATLVQQAFSNEIDSKLEIEVIATNNHDKKAYISGMDWELYLKESLYSNGVISKPVEILPRQQTSFVVETNINLYQIIHSKSLMELLAIVIEKKDAINLSDLDAVLKVKPWYLTGSSVKKYPGFIKINL